MTLQNETTLSAMKEAESGEDAGIVNIDSGKFYRINDITKEDNRKRNF